jgi:hypothetical protein
MVLKRIQWLALLLLPAALTGCPGELDPNEFPNGGVETSSCADVPAQLAQRCGSDGCHGGAQLSANLDLKTAGVGARLLDKPAQCGGVLASQAAPDDSVLVKKLRGTTCGSRMPIGGQPFSSAEVACIRTWIADGAK